MAEQSTFARRMMAQKLMTEKRDDPFSDSRFFAGKMRPSMADIENPTRFSDMAGPAYGAAATGSLFAPGAGIADVMGYAPDPMQSGKMLPSFGENIGQGNYLDAGLQTLGVAGDVLQAGGAFVPPLAIAGTMLKAPRAARVAKIGQGGLLSEVGEAAIRNVGSTGTNTPLTKEGLEKADETTKLLVSKILEKNPDAALGFVRSGSAAGDSNYLTFVTPSGAQGQIRISDHGTGTARLSDYFEQLPIKPPPEGKQVFGQISKKSFDNRVDKIVQAMTPPKTDPNEAAGAAMDAAQARYFETGKFEPPTAENPVSIVQPTETDPGIIAFHGSGADFDEFRLEMIGTGEGAQAYGYGLYFTDSEDIARFYKDALTEPGGVPLTYKGKRLDTPYTNEIEERFADELAGLTEVEKDDFVTVLANLSQINLKADAASLRESSIIGKGQKNIFDNIIDDVVQPELGEGKIYKVGLAPKPDELLDYDLPLSQQPKMLELIDDVHGDPEIIIQQAGLDPATATGGDFVKALGGIGQEQGAKAASEFLAKAGITGLKYRAAGSRATTTVDEAAERNYVIFDDKAVNIMEKYGIVGPVAVTAAGAAAVNRGRNDNDNGGSILPDAGIM